MPESDLDGPDWVELVEMLHFLRGWIAGAGPEVEQSLRDFVGDNGYPLEQLVANLNRFGLLLSGNDDEELFELREF